MFGEGGRAKFIAARRPPDEKLNVVWIDMSRDQWGGGDSMKHWNGLTWANWAANDTVTDVIYQRIQYAEDTSTAALAAADQASINSANTIGEVNELATELATVKDLAGEANQNALDALSNIPDKIDKSAIERSAIHGTRTVLTAIAPTKISKSEVEITAFNSNVEAPGTYTQSTMKIKGQDGIEFESDPEGLVIKATDADCVPKEAIERSDISGKRTVLTAVAPTNVSASEIEITAFNSDVENKGTYTQSILKIKGEGTIEFAADPEGLIIKSNAQSDGISKDCIERSDTSKKRTVVTAVAPTNITADEIEITQFSSDIDDKNTFTQSVLKIKGGGAIGFEADTDGIIIKAEVPAAPSVPTALPTPNKLKIGSYEFDGSTEVNATFPAIPTKLPNPYTLRLWKCLDEFSADVYDLDYDGSTNVSVTSKLLKLVDANDNVVGTYKPLINGNITNNVTTIKLPAIPTSAPTSGSYDFQVIYN
jgi:hypothetical protein